MRPHGGWAGKAPQTKAAMARASKRRRALERQAAKAAREGLIRELYVSGWLAGDIALALDLSMPHVRKIVSQPAHVQSNSQVPLARRIGEAMNQLNLICGPSGAGKTTWAHREIFAGYVVVETDQFFTNPRTGKYEFDPHLLAENHAKCQQLTRLLLEAGKSVIVANTNVRREHRDIYRRIAAETRAGISVFAFNPLALDADVLAARNIHDVPKYVIERQLTEFELDPDMILVDPE